MSERQLKNPPIVEALLEVKWALKSSDGMQPIDPNYQLLLGSFWQLVKGSYPYHERLPAATIPDEVTGPVVKHRFRTKKGEWPLLQLGPGIMSVNETEKYTTFEKFKPLALDAIAKLFQAYPGDLQIDSLMLRYIDAVEMDYSKDDVSQFLRDSMHVPVGLPEFLLKCPDLEPKPANLVFRTSLRCKTPPGMGTLSFSTGLKEGKRSLVWEQILQSAGDDIGQMPSEFEKWLTAAHAIIDGWFWKIIEGELKGRFNGT